MVTIGQSNTLVFKVNSLLVKFDLFITLYTIGIHPNIVWFFRSKNWVCSEPFIEERSYESLQVLYYLLIDTPPLTRRPVFLFAKKGIFSGCENVLFLGNSFFVCMWDFCFATSLNPFKCYIAS